MRPGSGIIGIKVGFSRPVGSKAGVKRKQLVEQSRKKRSRYLLQKSHGPEVGPLGNFICGLCKHETHKECSDVPLVFYLSIDTECSSGNLFQGLEP